ncbi:thiamine pyrophosphate-binding protein [Bosea sp. (in: a-proteobacteria)]|uniref:thiamine pyrophosphate-binding protein n=1 Tax=Bosea sp. (in: a-proteobacteria) TaxID=1871050 RepID=UPI002627556B|nr:thiamine pyrophosphate-binding protein [Bosea sp. (in: a-proteobacteria)]MCO5089754.1 thiamine pyrophosphate-binding protein [Bosea sp. (in: a-proteobacteria)]
MNTPYTVSDLVAEFLDLCQVSTVFGIVSVHNIPMLDAISRRNRVRFVMTRGELGAGHMADGYGRATGKLGVLFTSTGPGAANAVTGLLEARFAGTPLLHITGQTATRFVDRGAGTVHDVADQLGMLRSVGKSAYRIRTPEEALGVLTRAVADALEAPTGPVSVEIPIDVQRAPLQRPETLDTFTPPLSPPRPPAQAELDAVVARILRAKRPMLWLGRGAAQAGPAARRLLDLGFGMVTSWAGRGVVPEDHPMCLGSLNGNGLPMVESFYETVDLMIVAGSRLRGHETGDGALALPRTRIQIDVDPLANGRTYAADTFVCADAALTLTAIADRIEGKLALDPGFGAEFRALKQETRAAFKATLGPYGDFAQTLRDVMPKDAIWARDITINNSTWGNKLLSLFETRANIYPIGAGIGQGLSLGIGAALCPDKRKVVIMTGDGGFFLNMTELWTAVQEDLDVTILVMNDRGYGVIRHIQDAAAGGRRRFDNLLGPDLEKVAALAGIPFWRVSSKEEFGPAAAAAIATKGPTLVEVDMTAIGDHPPYYPYGPKAQPIARA